jgi:predicted RNA polymerase sigma factor
MNERATALARLDHLDEARAAADRAMSLSTGEEAEKFGQFRDRILPGLDAPTAEK